jgi:RHS repeat-associated protein
MPCASGVLFADPQVVGDPVDTLSGAVFDRKLEFRLTGPIELRWFRHYNSSQNNQSFALGWGHTHEFDRVLRSHRGGFTYIAPVGRTFDFPALAGDGEQYAHDGFTLRRLSAARYHLLSHGEPAMEFVFQPAQTEARLGRLFEGDHEIVFRYDANHLLTGIVDATGRRVRVVEGQDRRLKTLTLEAGPAHPQTLLVEYRYDAAGNLVGTRNASGHGHTFAYDRQNRLVRVTGRKGFQFQFQYDPLGRCVRATGDDQLYGVTLDYRVPGRLTTVTRADGGTWSYTFDRAGNLARIADPLGGVQLFVRDDRGRVVLEVDPLGNLTRVIYDPAGAALARIGPYGRWTPIPEDPNAVDPRASRVPANAAEYQHGSLLNVREITLPAAGWVPQDLLPEARSLVVRREIPEESQTVPPPFAVRPLGIVWWPKPPAGRVFTALGKLVEQHDSFGRLRRWQYDPSGNVARYVDFDGGEWAYDYGTWHLLRGIRSPIGAEVRFSYTTNAELSSCTDAGGTRSEYVYDAKDQLVEVRRQGVLRDRYVRDSVGNLVAKYGSDGRELLRFEIGPGNLPTTRRLASGDEHTFRYDAAGRCVLAATQRDRVECAYNGFGDRVLDTRNGRGVVHRYRARGQTAESVILERYTVRYEVGSHGALVITDPGGKSHEVRLLQHGMVERRFSNGSREAAQYDNSGRCLFKCSVTSGGRIWRRQYRWSGEGELQRVDDELLGEVRHEYDSAHRLRRRLIAGRVESYEFDIADNLVSQPGLAGVSLDPGNRLKTANGYTFGYNDRNHMDVRQTAGATVRYGYDSRDLLIRVETPQGVWGAEYDAFGRRVRKSWAGRTTEYYWSGEQLIAEAHSDGHLRLYVYADPLALTPLLFLDYDSASVLPEFGQRYFVFSDQLGTPQAIEAEDGTEVWRARIAPFGQSEHSSEPTVQFNLRFPGHYLDPELELQYNRFRYYDPVLGRYLQSDPWGITGGYNLYGYRTNPLLTADVRGLGEEEEPKGKSPKEDEEGTAKPGAGEEGGQKALKDMSPEELKAHVDERSQALKQAFADADPEGEKATTLSVGVVEKNGDPETRKVVVTTSADNQELPSSVQGAMQPGEEARATPPTIERGPRYDNPDYDPAKGKDPRNNPKTKTDPVIVDPNTGEQTPYTKAENGVPVEGTKHHAEQRMEAGAAENNETVLAQQPTKPCCPGCTKVLGDNGNLSKIPNP